MTNIDHRAGASLDDAPAAIRRVVRRWPSKRAQAWSLETVRMLQDQPEVVAIVAVGSAVRDVDSSEDVDLVVIYDRQRPPIPRAPMDVDIRLYDRAAVDDLVGAGHDYLGWALRFGRIVLDRARYWQTLRDRWEDQLPLPSANDARERAARAETLCHELTAVGDEDAAAEQLLSAFTHRARACLLEASIYPQSRPELAHQLREIGENSLAGRLADALERRSRRGSPDAPATPRTGTP